MREVLLVIDCSNRCSSLGLVADGRDAGARSLDLGREQAAKLPSVAGELLADAGLTVKDVTTVAVTVGPGYFTGIRIGMAYAAGMAYALGVEIVPLSSLAVVLRSFLNWNVGVKVPLLAASRDVAFSSVWRDGQQIVEEKERTHQELSLLLSEISRNYELCAVKDARLFATTGVDDVKFAESPDGQAAARLAWELRDESIKPDGLKARYLREPGLGRPL